MCVCVCMCVQQYVHGAAVNGCQVSFWIALYLTKIFFCGGGRACAMVSMWKSEDSFEGSPLSSHQYGPLGLNSDPQHIHLLAYQYGPNFFLETESLTKPGVHFFRKSGRLALSSGNPPASTSSALGL